MPDLGLYHPIIVDFVVALLFVGVGLRILSVIVWPSFARPAATLLLLLGIAATVLAVKSGQDAHGPAERIPGAREIVEHHEETAERTRTILLVVGALELAALAFWNKPWTRWILATSGAIGIFGLFSLFEAAKHGGEVVYQYAGGVGVRSGDPADVERLLVAGLYHQAREDRAAGRLEDAARLVDELARRRPADIGVQLLHAESLVEDHRDPATALSALATIRVPADDSRSTITHGLLRARAWEVLNEPDSARAILTALQRDFPNSTAVTERLNRLRP